MMRRITTRSSTRTNENNVQNCVKSKANLGSSVFGSDITNLATDKIKKGIKVPKVSKSYASKRTTRLKKIPKIEEETLTDINYSDDAMIVEDETPIEINQVTKVEYEDIDEYDYDDPQSVAIYVNDIYEHCFETEGSFMVNPNYMENQYEIQERMRGILIDWLIEVHLKFELLPETMYLAVNMIDRFLEKVSVRKSQLQLVGMTCLFIAAKYEEIYPPECNDFVYVSANAYTREEIFEMEQKILNTLNFSLTTPTSIYFLRRFSKAARSDYRTHTLCKYILELSLVDMRMLKYKPSMIAAASVILARIMLDNEELWTPTLMHYTKYTPNDLIECALCQVDLLKTSQIKKQAPFKKYSLSKFSSVALIPVPEEKIQSLIL